jgi:acyl carrier protein
MTEERLRRYLKDRFRNYRDDLATDADLTGIVDSLGLFELVEFVEREFGIAIPTEDFTPARFASIQSILALIDDLRTRGARARS